MFEYEYVIIGNSAAGVGALEGIRKNDRTSSAAVISSETHHTYSRPLISYLLLGKTDRERMKYRADSFYEDNHADFFPGETAVSVDPDAHTVTAESGKVFSYKKLICATGSSPFVPPFAGLDTVDRKFTFMSLDDADSLAASIGESTRVLIVGAGLIGLKCAEGIAARVKSVTVVDLAPRVLSSILTEDAAETVRAHIESAADVKFHLGTSVKEFRGDTAILDDGEEIGFDVLVLAVGVRANTSLLAAAGAKTERGISVDRGMRTTLPDIYAAGDAVQGYDSSVGTLRTNGAAVSSVSVDMGYAEFAPEKIPVLSGGKMIGSEITAGGMRARVTALSVGNPHAVVFCGDIASLDLEKIGSAFEHHPLFPERVNTEFVRIISRTEIEMRVWERGSGETWACGTGACAAVCAAVENSLCDAETDVRVRLHGGELTVRVGADRRITMEGDAVWVYDGTFDFRG